MRHFLLDDFQNHGGCSNTSVLHYTCISNQLTRYRFKLYETYSLTIILIIPENPTFIVINKIDVDQ